MPRIKFIEIIRHDFLMTYFRPGRRLWVFRYPGSLLPRCTTFSVSQWGYKLFCSSLIFHIRYTDKRQIWTFFFAILSKQYCVLPNLRIHLFFMRGKLGQYCKILLCRLVKSGKWKKIVKVMKFGIFFRVSIAPMCC